MSSVQNYIAELSGGERSVLLAYIMIALFGAGLSFVVVNQLGNQGEILRHFTFYDTWVVLSGAVGAASGLYIGRRWFGRPGLIGYVRTLVGVLVVSGLGSLIAGSLALPVYGTMFGPLALAVTVYENATVGVLWAMTLICCHVLFASYQRERETLFREPVPSGLPYNSR